ncbi:MAG TPA: hypothetical protein VNO54_10670, partial [Streptosporangiaceae bacterium]|nr:hypothetical protein [Streptosporangiaceae bacterium]
MPKFRGRSEGSSLPEGGPEGRVPPDKEPAETRGPSRVWAEVVGGDALGRGQQPALCWWLPEGSAVQHAYQL